MRFQAANQKPAVSELRIGLNGDLSAVVRIKMKANANEPVEISHDEIARLAYLKWKSEGCPEGRSEQHWLDAERLLRTAKMAVAKESKPVKAKVKQNKPSNGRKLAAV